MQRRHLACFAAVVALSLATVPSFATAAPAAQAHTPTPAALAQTPPAKAYVLVDADTGAVIAQQDAHTVYPPASTIKLLTALIASQRLRPDEAIPISPVAEGMPARKINVKAGQAWRAQDLMYSLLLVSANDAAVALAEKIGDGSLDNFVTIADQAASRLGLVDRPVLNDPAGLDDEFSHEGGSLISARDLAIVSRAVLATPELMTVIGARRYEFQGGDGLGHTLTNHNLLPNLYPGATGLKTGTTDLAGHTFVGSATRNGRTMLAVVFGAVDSYGSAESLLDQGFATPVTAETGLDHLPAVVADASLPPPPPPSVPSIALATPVVAKSGGDSILDSPTFAFVVLLVGIVPLIAIRRRVVIRARADRARDAGQKSDHNGVIDLTGDFESTGAPR